MATRLEYEQNTQKIQRGKMVTKQRHKAAAIGVSESLYSLVRRGKAPVSDKFARKAAKWIGVDWRVVKFWKPTEIDAEIGKLMPAEGPEN